MDIFSAINGMKNILELASRAIELRDHARLVEAQLAFNVRAMEISSLAYDMQEKNAALQKEKLQAEDTIKALREENRQMRSHERELAEYEPHRTAGGGFCLFKEGEAETGRPPLYLCANCANGLKKTYLQIEEFGKYLNCSEGHGRIPGVVPQVQPFIEIL